MAAGELAAKHLIAQASKAFFGYGPSRAGIWLQGRLAVFASALTGPGMQLALAEDPFGRLCMRHINGLYVQQTRAAITQAAAGWGVRLRSVASDLDLKRRWALGVGIAETPLPGAAPEREAPAELRALLAEGLGRPVREVLQGDLLVHARTDLPAALAPAPANDAQATVTHLQAWGALRDDLEATLIRRVAGTLPLHTWAAVGDGAGGLLVVLVTAPAAH